MVTVTIFEVVCNKFNVARICTSGI